MIDAKYVGVTANQLAKIASDLKAENAELRKFAAHAWQIMTRNEPMFVWKGMVEDARELGIEVK